MAPSASGGGIGSGVIEAGCKTVVGSRCKQSGRFWRETGAENILAVRSLHASGRREEFWRHRLHTLAARNDPLEVRARTPFVLARRCQRAASVAGNCDARGRNRNGGKSVDAPRSGT